MIVIVCLDDRGGMRFHERRQSRDRAVCARIAERTAGSCLWMNAASAKLFSALALPQLRVDESFLARAGAGEFCFAESDDLAAYADRVERLIVYRWNRVYPADRYFPLDLHAWRQTARTEFAGYSHETLTEEVYTR